MDISRAGTLIREQFLKGKSKDGDCSVHLFPSGVHVHVSARRHLTYLGFTSLNTSMVAGTSNQFSLIEHNQNNTEELQ